MSDAVGISMNGQPVAPATGEKTLNAQPPVVTWDESDKLEKVGGVCCGCCCDYRRAVIIVDIIMIVLSILSLVTTPLIDAEDRYEYKDIDDDAVLDKLDDTKVPLTVIAALGVVFFVAPLIGAIKYRSSMVMFGILWLVVSYISQVVIIVLNTNDADKLTNDDESVDTPVPGFVISFIVIALVIYPHAMLVRELQQGIMTKETYIREKHSCCCVSSPAV